MEPAPLLRLEGVGVRFSLPGGTAHHAVADVTLDIHPGEAVGIVGESGSGKTTLARTILDLQRPSTGRVLWRGHDLWAMRRRDRRRLGGVIQAVSQDARGSLNPRRPVGDAVAEPLFVHGGRRGGTQEAVAAQFRAVGLDPALTTRLGAELSGGQCQRVAIARATILRPSLLVADEPVSALDVSVQAQVLHVLHTLRRENGMALLLISHDIAVVRTLVDRIVVMRGGVVVEQGPTETLISEPRTSYLADLLAAVLEPHAQTR